MYSYLSKNYLNISNKFTTFVEKLIIDIFSMNTAVIYARVSSTGDRQTTERQVADLKKYISINEMELVSVGKGARVRPSTAGGSRPAIIFSI